MESKLTKNFFLLFVLFLNSEARQSPGFIHGVKERKIDLQKRSRNKILYRNRLSLDPLPKQLSYRRLGKSQVWHGLGYCELLHFVVCCS